MTTPADVDALLEVQRRSYGGDRAMRENWPEHRALDAAGLIAFLERHRYAVLATSRPDGRPQARPIAFLLAAGSFWIGSRAGARVRNLRAHPWGSLVAMEGDAAPGEPGVPHVALAVEGPVVLHEGAEDERLRRWLDELWAARHGDEPDWAAAFIELRPQRVFSNDARTV